MRQSDVMKATPGTIGLRICALAALLTGCGFEQKSADSPQPQPAPPPLPLSFTQTVEVFQVAFDMVLVPGDEAKGIKTLYVGKHETDSMLFFLWALTHDIKDPGRAAELRAKQLRPSLVYTSLSETYHGPRDNSPAAGMSRMCAQLFCAWLSEQTGRAYRLPTEREWVHTFGRRSFRSPEEACEYAVFSANSTIVSKVEPPASHISRDPSRPGSLAPNEFGLYDMAGNVAEWVTDTGDERVVRGGHYLSPLEEIGLPGRLVEDQAVWNLSLFGYPMSKWWYVDAPWTGFRLVCEP